MKKPLSILLCLFVHNLHAQNVFKNWPAATSPTDVGQRVTERLLLSPHRPIGGNTKPHIHYSEVCTWYGALTFAKQAKKKDLTEKLIGRFEPLFNKDSSLLPVPDHVDFTVFGTVPLEIYLQKGDKKYLELGKHYADKQWAAPEGPRVIPESYTYYNKGLTWQTRMWIDDMYMITMVQSQAYRATNDRKYIDRAAKEMVLYLDSLQQPNGLFYHAPDVPFYWGRGNGWMAAGMAELLSALPKNNENYPQIMKGYTTMMASLLQHQAEDGMWRQLIDDTASWKETSCTGMFAFAMITGVKNGWLDKATYGPAARKAWLSLITYIDDNGNITNVCEGTGKKNDRQYYLDRKRLTGDMHGQAPVLWCATALLRK
jgi:unsaturated rhamnogalacturonyl hydrolase